MLTILLYGMTKEISLSFEADFHSHQKCSRAIARTESFRYFLIESFHRLIQVQFIFELIHFSEFKV